MNILNINMNELEYSKVNDHIINQYGGSWNALNDNFKKDVINGFLNYLR